MEPTEVKDEESKYLFSLIKEIDHPNIMKVDYFIENHIFYVVRTYDDDYVTHFSILFFILNLNLNVILTSMVSHGDYKFKSFSNLIK